MCRTMIKKPAKKLTVVHSAREGGPSSLQIVEDMFRLVRNEKGQFLVSFTANRGKGSGLQYVPVAEFTDLLATMEQYVSAKPSTCERPTASEMFRRSFENDEGLISFRLNEGKGAKPVRISAEEFPR